MSFWLPIVVVASSLSVFPWVLGITGDYWGISPWFLPCFSLNWDEKPRTSDLAGTTMSFELFGAPDGKPQVGIPHLQWGSWGI